METMKVGTKNIKINNVNPVILNFVKILKVTKIDKIVDMNINKLVTIQPSFRSAHLVRVHF